jgi:hypothetical protein
MAAFDPADTSSASGSFQESWFRQLIKRAKKERSEDLLFVDGLKLDETQGPVAEPATLSIDPDESYIELYVESLRIEKARAFATRFHGVVYLFARLSRLGEDTLSVASVTKPANIAELDAGSLNKVITISRKMLGPVPWRGGELAIELGLFAVKSGNLLSPMVDFVAKISDTAGVGFLGAAKPFIPLITQGMDLIAGQASDAKLAVGVDTALSIVRPIMCAIIAAPRGSFDRESLRVDPSDKKLLFKGTPLQAGYCVFSIRATDRKSDFGAIPELRESFAALRKAALEGESAPAREALAAFKRAVFLSPDLISRDAARLVGFAERIVAEALTPPQIKFAGPRTAERTPPSPPAELSDIPLYR